MGDEVRQTFPVDSRLGEEPGNRDAEDTPRDAERLRPQESLEAVGGNELGSRDPQVKSETRISTNHVQDGVRKSNHDSGKKNLLRGLATTGEVDKWFSLCQWDNQDDIFGGPTEHVFFLGPICDVEPGERTELSGMVSVSRKARIPPAVRYGGKGSVGSPLRRTRQISSKDWWTRVYPTP